LSVADQLHRSLGSISANLTEGYSRSKGLDRARFLEFALGSARKPRLVLQIETCLVAGCDQTSDGIDYTYHCYADSNDFTSKKERYSGRTRHLSDTIFRLLARLRTTNAITPLSSFFF
jgi:hypothetical protein